MLRPWVYKKIQKQILTNLQCDEYVLLNNNVAMNTTQYNYYQLVRLIISMIVFSYEF